MSVDIAVPDDSALNTLLKKANFDSDVIYGLMCEITSSCNCQCCCVVYTDDSAANVSFLSLAKNLSHAPKHAGT